LAFTMITTTRLPTCLRSRCKWELRGGACYNVAMVSEAVTDQIRVHVRSSYVPHRSDPDKQHYFYAYRIRITNEGEKAAKLLSRHWIITDGYGLVEEVKGLGVVGDQPRLEPGETYEYTSACPLSTQYGVMRGTYHMVDDDGRKFDVEISPFTLFIPALAN